MDVEELPSLKELWQLSLRALVAYAARCARRVQPLYRSENPEHVEAVERTISMAEQFAASDSKTCDTTIGTTGPSGAGTAIGAASRVADACAAEAAKKAEEAARAANALLRDPDATEDDLFYPGHTEHEANAAQGTLDCAARAARAAAISAVKAVEFSYCAPAATVHKAIVSACRADFQHLAKRYGPTSYLGEPIDLTAMGRLWPEGEPEWFRRARRVNVARTVDELASKEGKPDIEAEESKSPIAGPLKVYIDADAYSPEEKGRLLSLISELYAIQTGDRLVIDNTGFARTADVLDPAPVGGPEGNGR
ncbi:MAG: hypothetical protein A2V70_05040 [Planctomycetes bacterium RBG_13_63_9]|nr:MAG: hypothetical protein A2V70_05040 [Planctomycetes bacterium RBG_13_63_9]